MAMLARVWDEDEEAAADEEDELLEQAMTLLAMLHAGAEECRRLRAERRLVRRTYLTRPDLLPNPRMNTAWQAMYENRSDRAFITTMARGPDMPVGGS